MAEAVRNQEACTVVMPELVDSHMYYIGAVQMMSVKAEAKQDLYFRHQAQRWSGLAVVTPGQDSGPKRWDCTRPGQIVDYYVAD